MGELVSNCILSGERFSPERAEAILDLHFDVKNEVGELGTIGKYRGREIPYGSGTINSPEVADDLSNSRVLHVICDNLDKLYAIGLEDIMFTLIFEYDEQCNFELSYDFMSQFVQLGIALSISCYKR